MRILNNMQFTIPEASLRFESDVLGRSSDIIFDNNKFNDFNKTISVRMFKEDNNSIAQQFRDVAKWIRTDNNYSKLVFSEYDEYYYKAICYAEIKANDEKREWLDIDFTFKCQPFIYRQDGESERSISNGGSITNHEEFESLPVIKFEKTTQYSDSVIYITNNNEKKQFRISKEAGNGFITIDCENGIAYKDGQVNISKYCLMDTTGYKPITLLPGKSTFNFVGIGNFKIIPNWRTIAV